MCIVPESNRWVHKNKGSDSAPLLDSSSDTSNGREVINNNDKNVNSSEEKCTKSCGSSAKGLCKALMSSKRAFVTGIILAVFQQVTGINAVIMYSPSIIETLGLTEMRQKLIATIFVGVWNFISTFISTCLVCYLELYIYIFILIIFFRLIFLVEFHFLLLDLVVWYLDLDFLFFLLSYQHFKIQCIIFLFLL